MINQSIKKSSKGCPVLKTRTASESDSSAVGGDIYARVSFPYMCNTNTEKMNSTLMTSTGTGPTLKPGESSV